MANLHGTCASGGKEKESEKDLHWVAINCSLVQTFNQNKLHII